MKRIWIWTCSTILTGLGILMLQASFFPVHKASADPPEAVDPSSIVGKALCGYQGWFNCEGDGSPIDLLLDGPGWRHWSNGEPPAPGHQTFELYPDITEYPPSTLFPTGYLSLGDGGPAALFSSFSGGVVDRHFAWMETYGIDGVALQRFGIELRDPPDEYSPVSENRDAVTLEVKNAAEKYGRVFYVMYDITGMSQTTTADASEFTTVIMKDWEEHVADPYALDLLSSPRYLHQDGKPVVGIWGIGFLNRPGTPRQFLNLIAWFREQGCYIVGGVPLDWRRPIGNNAKPFFAPVYLNLDMISPWTVGAFSTDSEISEWIAGHVLPDLRFLSRLDIDYQPVIFPGFAWSNWADGTRNAVPRRAGAFFWRQVYGLRLAGVNTCYIAMFDEYDEATAIAKSAEDSFMIPVDQYFLTLSADGTYLSSDFYLRLTGRATEMLRGAMSPVPWVPIPASLGPVFFRTDFEAGLDAQPAWTSSVDESGGGIINIGGFAGSGAPECSAVGTGHAADGEYALRIAGRDLSSTSSHVYFRVFDVDIPIGGETMLCFRLYPEQDLGRFISLDLVMTDGTTLRESGAVDQNGVSLHPAAGRGVVLAWNEIQCRIGQWLDGKVIDRIIVAYDQPSSTGDFSALIDGITLFNEE